MVDSCRRPERTTAETSWLLQMLMRPEEAGELNCRNTFVYNNYYYFAGNGHGDESDCISHSTNTLGKGMNPIILPPAMGK